MRKSKGKLSDRYNAIKKEVAEKDQEIAELESALNRAMIDLGNYKNTIANQNKKLRQLEILANGRRGNLKLVQA